MATVTEASHATEVTPETSLDGDRWVEFPATWKIYTALCELSGDRRRPKYTYVNGRMMVVSPGHSHESYGVRLIELIHEIFVGLSIECHGAGSTTLKKTSKSRAGTEADATYYFNNIDLVQEKEHLVMGVDPAPDLVVEVVISHPEKNALEAYRRFKVREVWVCKQSSLEFLVLGADGRYAVSPVSFSFPFLSSDELAPWVYRDHRGSDTRVLKQFRAWVSETLAPRCRPTE